VQFVLSNNLLRDVVNFDSNVFVSHHKRVEVEVFNIHHHVSCIPSGNDAVHIHFEKCQVRCWSANIAWVVNFITTDGKSCSAYLLFVQLKLTHKFCICYIFPSITRNLIFVDEEENGVGALNSASNPLCKSSKFIGGRVHPYLAVFRVSYQLSVL
jgi:hypothetical protein